MWPARAICAARGALWEFSNNQHVRLFRLFAGVYKCLASERTSSFETNVETATNDLPITHDTFRK